jgi:hypothetical protein
MKLKAILGNLVPARWRRAGTDEPLSIVLLLRRPHFFRVGELQTAAEKAWGISVPSGDGSMHSVVQKGTTTLMKFGPHLLSLFHYPKPYVDNPQENISWLPQESQREAWAEHAACVGVDYVKGDGDTDSELAYCVLAKLVAEMLDENCAGIYVPRENSLIPNNESLYMDLQKMASARNTGIDSSRPNSQ